MPVITEEIGCSVPMKTTGVGGNPARRHMEGKDGKAHISPSILHVLRDTAADLTF